MVQCGGENLSPAIMQMLKLFCLFGHRAKRLQSLILEDASALPSITEYMLRQVFHICSPHPEIGWPRMRSSWNHIRPLFHTKAMMHISSSLAGYIVDIAGAERKYILYHSERLILVRNKKQSLHSSFYIKIRSGRKSWAKEKVYVSVRLYLQ